MFENFRIVAIIPCYNEEAAVAPVIQGLFRVIPGIRVVVYDNASTDATTQVAIQEGAEVRHEPRKGKGNVVRRAFADIDADIYLLVDGDDTYDISAAPMMIEKLIGENLDHVLGCRTNSSDHSAYRPGHELGNRLFNRLVSFMFKDSVTDMLSGYRIFSRRFVKSFPALSQGFEIETELTIHSMGLRVPQAEVPVGFKDRPEGSESKLNTFKDGFKILSLIFKLFAFERPFAFYGLLSVLLLLISCALGIPVVFEYLNTGLVLRLPTALLATALALLGAISFMIGIVLEGVQKSRRENMRLSYLQLPTL